MYVYSLVMPKHACAPQPVAPECVTPAISPATLHDFPKFKIFPDGRVWNNKRKTFVSIDMKSVYDTVHISRGSNNTYVTTKTTVHRLLALYFVPNPEGKQYVDHIDKNKKNNSISNLRWVTAIENGQNALLAKRNESGVQGVSRVSKSTGRKLWRARIQVNKKARSKHFETFEEACAWRAEMEKLHYIQ